MPRIPDHHLRSVFYLYPDEARAAAGDKVGGTGFFCASPPPDGHDGGEFQSILWLVTNKHVVQDGNWVLRITKADGSNVQATVDEKAWVYSEDYDLAIANAGFLKGVISDHDLHYVHGDMVTPSLIQKFDIGIGDDLILLGRFINWDGAQTNRPVARFGHIAQMPNPNEKGGKILAEIRSIGGFSGSPVLLHIPSTDYVSEPTVVKRPPKKCLSPVLVGVNSAHTSIKTPILDPNGRENGYGYHFAANTGLAVLEPAWALRELMISARSEKTKKAGPIDTIYVASDGLTDSDKTLERMLNSPPSGKA